ncbi:MAG: caspase family protein [Treponema sp.]|nr:caspase family protein [Treponema sp.]
MKTSLKRILVLFSLLSLFSVNLYSQEEIVTMERYALVIGNDHYQEYPLKTSVSDSELITKALESKGFFVFHYKDIDSEKAVEVFKSYSQFVNKDPKNVSVIYYSGHGFTDGKENYLVPVDNGDIHDVKTLKEKSISLNSVTDNIYSATQLYIIDAGYDNPFKSSGTRGIGIKGSLAKVKSKNESSVAYLFSSQPEVPVLQASGKTSVFADSLAQQIMNSSSEIPQVFEQVRLSVFEKTNKEQQPYVSATGVTFAFGGEQYSRFMSRQQSRDLDSARELSALSQSSVDEYNSSLQSIVEDKARSGQEAKLRLEEEIRLQKEKQYAEDRARAQQELEASKLRTFEENAEIDRRKREFESMAASQKASVGKSVSPDAKIEAIEELKGKIRTLRDDVEEKISDYSRDVDIDCYDKIDAIKNAPYGISETDSEGRPVKAALERRERKAEEIRKEALSKKADRSKELHDSIKKTDSQAIASLKKMYSSLESQTYTSNSFTEELTVRVMDFDGESASWPLVITSTLFGYTNLFDYTIPLSYQEVTGKRYIPIDKMSDKQFAEYSENVELYDSLFRSSTDIFYITLTYKIMVWDQPSVYRFIPVKCDVVRMDKKRSKVIHTEKEDLLKPREFVIYPQVEVRTYDEITKAYEKAAKIKEKEYEEEVKKSVASVEESSYRTENLAKEKPAKEKKENIQIGRAGLFVNLENNFALDSGIQNSSEYFDQISGEIDVPTGKFSFMGFNFSLYRPEIENFTYWDVGLDFGFSCRLGSHIRPFIKFSGNSDNGLNIIGKVGGGVDFMFLKLLGLTVGYDYAFYYSYGDLFGLPSAYSCPNDRYQKLYLGFAFTW